MYAAPAAEGTVATPVSMAGSDRCTGMNVVERSWASRMPKSVMVALAFGLGASACASSQATPAPAPVAVTAPEVHRARPAADEKQLPIPEALELTTEGRAAVQILGNASEFGGWAVGYGGRPLPAVAALRTLIDDKHAAAALGVVIDHGSLAGQLMAVSGLYFVDRTEFEERLAPYRSMQTTVPVRVNGCLIHAEPTEVAELVEANGAMAYLGPNDTFAAWSARNPGAKTLVFDIVGGAYPHGLRGAQ